MPESKPAQSRDSGVHTARSGRPDESAVADVAVPALVPDVLDALTDEELEAVAAGKRVGRIGGRQKGTGNHVGRAARRLSRKLVSDPAYLKSVEQRLLEGRAPNLETLLWHYAYGRPAQQVNLDGQMAVAQVTVVKAW